MRAVEVGEVCVGRGADLAQALAAGQALGGRGGRGGGRGGAGGGPWVEVQMALGPVAPEGSQGGGGGGALRPAVTGDVLAGWPEGVPLVVGGAQAVAVADAVARQAARGGWPVRVEGSGGGLAERLARAAAVGRTVLAVDGPAARAGLPPHRLVAAIRVDAGPAACAAEVARWLDVAPDAWAWIGCDRSAGRAGALAALAAGAVPVAWIAAAAVPRLWQAEAGWLQGWLAEGGARGPECARLA